MQKGFAPLIVLIGALVIGILAFGGYWFLNKSKPSQVNQVANTTVPSPASASSAPILSDSSSIDKLNPSAIIKIPFERDGAIYLYEDGKEKLVAKPKQASTDKACYRLVYPFLSPNGKYIAYIEQMGGEPGYGGCLGGVLKVVYLDSGKIKTTNYKTSYLKWNLSNQITFSPDQERREGPQTYTIKQVLYDPANDKEIVFNTVMDQDKSTYAETMVSGEFPFDANKLVTYKNNKYYLMDKSSNKESFLLDKSQVERFLDWSLNGRYAIFESTKKLTQYFDAIELVVDTQNLTSQPKEIGVGRGGAGGDFSTGRKWYFEKGFVAYCRQDLYFVDGSKPLQLTNDGGGGCHNEEGFVATSPSGEYAFVKFKDRFELHTKNGEKKVISETTPLAKGRGVPMNLIWVNDDYMAIFERTTNADYGTGKPKVYLFDRKANVIKSVIENAYLN